MKKTYIIIALIIGFSMHLRIAKAQYEEDVKKFKNPCLNIEGSYDDFRKIKEMHTAVVRPDTMGTTLVEREPAVFYKTLSKGRITYSLSLNTTDSEPAATERGVIIIMANGKRINKPYTLVRTSVNYQAEYVRSCEIPLTPAELAMFKSVSIKEFELYDSQMIIEDGEFIRQMLSCLIKTDLAKATLK